MALDERARPRAEAGDGRVKRDMAAAQLEREAKLRMMAEGEQVELFHEMASKLQNAYRGRIGRKKAEQQRKRMQIVAQHAIAAVKIQGAMRGCLGRMFVKKILEAQMRELVLGASATNIQKAYRGMVGRHRVREIRRNLASRFIQRVFRGHLGRMAAERERARLEALRRRAEAATLIQATWQMKVAREEYRMMRIHIVAATELQRTYRGHLGRKKAQRRRDWENAEPGPERLRLGLRLIEESKVAFERQQEEIDALHRAQEKAEARVSHIHAELKESEKELSVLERELQEIDQIERDLHELTHEREILQIGITGAAGVAASGEAPTDDDGAPPVVGGGRGAGAAGGAEARQMQAESYALEIAIHRKRAERERKRQELESEFAAVFQEVSRKKHALERLEVSIADMESTRMRKDREFARLQRNLMELLQEQKYELDALREKGIELETATATSAAAATATAMRAKEHERRSASMFQQTEELMKFQFMSMSLSYFSSLNMLQKLRDMNADTTTAAVASSADAAAAAAAAASAANIPNIKHMKLGAEDVMDATLKKKQAELDAARQAEDEAKKSKAEPFPKETRLWSVTDVMRWLDTLALGQYKQAFKEASVDGEFLLELREEDLMQVLGMEHKLHVRKVILARDKLKPLDQREAMQKAAVITESKAQNERDGTAIPDIDTVFSQARNGRIKRLEDSLNAEFPLDSEDEKGNTLLLVSCQQCNHKMAEMLLARGANINHQNAHGNSPLHFAMAYDTEGTLGEYLIQKGADDQLENLDGMTPYDGIGAGA